MKFWYKIVDYDNNKIKTLFHGLNGSKIIPIKEWIKADKKMVRDGAGSMYLSGWHVIPSVELCLEYLKRFTNIQNKAIVKCKCKKVSKKEKSKSQVYLANYIYIEDIILNINKGDMI
jgi:hypothetical protein